MRLNVSATFRNLTKKQISGLEKALTKLATKLDVKSSGYRIDTFDVNEPKTWCEALVEAIYGEEEE